MKNVLVIYEINDNKGLEVKMFIPLESNDSTTLLNSGNRIDREKEPGYMIIESVNADVVRIRRSYGFWKRKIKMNPDGHLVCRVVIGSSYYVYSGDSRRKILAEGPLSVCSF